MRILNSAYAWGYILSPLRGVIQIQQGDPMAQNRKPSRGNMERRNFLKNGMLAGAAAIVRPAAGAAQQTPGAASEAEVLTTDTCGSDYMVDVINSLGFEYVCGNLVSRFRVLQE